MVPFFFRFFCIRISRKFVKDIQKSTIIFLSYCIRVIVSWVWNHKLKISTKLHFFRKIVITKRKFQKHLEKETGKGTEKGTPILTAKKRNEAGTTASILTKERGRNVFLNSNSNSQKWGTVNALLNFHNFCSKCTYYIFL